MSTLRDEGRRTARRHRSGVEGVGVRTPQARLITVAAPGGFSASVEAAGQPFDGDRTARWALDDGQLLGAAGEHRIDVVGRPPALPPT